jgi:circadian clock protein KaiB
MAISGEKMPNGSTAPNGDGSLQENVRIAAAFGEAVSGRQQDPAEYILRLYVTGSTPRSLKAIANLKRVCEEYLHDDYDLQVIDIYKNPDAARQEQIIAAPTLIKWLPAPLRRFVGDLSNTQKLLIGLGINE